MLARGGRLFRRLLANLVDNAIRQLVAEALAFEKLFLDAGAGAGVYANVFLSNEQAAIAVADKRIKGVALTGSERAGTAVAAEAGKALKKSTMELGGSDAFIVLDDADMDIAIKWGVWGRMNNTGQCCVAAKRFILDETIADTFVARFRAELDKLVPGDPMDPKTTLGPLCTKAAIDLVQKQIKTAVDGGAKVATGGKRIERKGYFLAPTILTDITADNPAYAQEFFAPVALVFRVKNEEEAIKLGQRLALRARRIGHHQGRRARQARRAPHRHRDGLRQSCHLDRPRAALRRREKFRLRPRAVGSRDWRVREQEADPRGVTGLVRGRSSPRLRVPPAPPLRGAEGRATLSFAMADAFYRAVGEVGAGRFASTPAVVGPWDPGSAHGSPPAALLHHVMEAAHPRTDVRVAQLTYDFFGPVPASEMVSTVRDGATRRAHRPLASARLSAGEDAPRWKPERLAHRRRPRSRDRGGRRVASSRSCPGPQPQRFFVDLPSFGLRRVPRVALRRRRVRQDRSGHGVRATADSARRRASRAHPARAACS